jgi:glycine hydroxymethyltransferase
MLEFGKQYVGQVIDNAKALGQALHEAGFNLLGENKGFTESHQIAIDVTKYSLGGDADRALKAANIIVNRQLLPGDIKAGRHYQNPGGIRIGASEITRIGMGKNNMSEVARLIKKVVINKEDPKKVKQYVAELRKNFQDVHYCFESAKKAYEYIRIR